MVYMFKNKRHISKLCPNKNLVIDMIVFHTIPSAQINNLGNKNNVQYYVYIHIYIYISHIYIYTYTYIQPSKMSMSSPHFSLQKKSINWKKENPRSPLISEKNPSRLHGTGGYSTTQQVRISTCQANPSNSWGWWLRFWLDGKHGSHVHAVSPCIADIVKHGQKQLKRIPCSFSENRDFINKQ